MAWLGTAASLGFVVGPALGGILARRDFHFTARYGHLMIDGFSIPFFAAAVLGLFTLAAAMRWLPESLSTEAPRSRSEETDPDWRTPVRSLAPLLGLALVAQFALAMFEATFALHAQAILNYGPSEVGTVFVVCGLVMAVFQIGASGLLAGRVGAMGQIGMGLVLMGTSLSVLMVPRRIFSVLAVVGLLALGMALIPPNLSALISTRGGPRRAGTALGAQNAASSLGQASGPLVGGALFVWQMNAPYVLSGGMLVAIALVIGWKTLAGRR
jgi:DHA1 family multidrug resistance protein-like MFS transporter